MSALLAGAVLLTLLLAGCRDRATAPEYVARVGEQYLRPSQLREALQNVPAGMDSAAARRQIIGQWTTGALLYREAQQRGLADDPGVKERLEKSRQSVLVNALLGQFYDELPEEADSGAVRAYFQRHREALRFAQPHVRVRHLATAGAAEARAARRRLQLATQRGGADTAWAALIPRYAADTARARRLANEYLPEQPLFADLPAASERLARLDDRQLAPVFEAGGRYHLLQLVDRAPAGTLPEFEWVEDEVRQRFLLQRRKQMYARQVERLRNQARSSGELEGDG